MRERRWSDLDLQIAADPRHPCGPTLKALMEAEERLEQAEAALRQFVDDVEGDGYSAPAYVHDALASIPKEET